MKKFLILLLIILSGCQDKDQSVFSTYDQQENNIDKKQEISNSVSPIVMVHGISGVTNGYIIDEEDNKKWIVTLASVVSGHPNALIITSEKQQLVAKVMAIDKENNLAILLMKKSAGMKPIEFSNKAIDHEEEQAIKIGEARFDEEENMLGILSIAPKNKTYEEAFINSNEIKKLLLKANENPISYNERLLLIDYFKDFPSIKLEPNLISDYEKSTFTYNPDELEEFIVRFQKSLNEYFQTKDMTEVKTFIASDDLVETVEQLLVESHSRMKFGEVKVKSMNAVEYQYVVEVTTTLTVGEETADINGYFKCILIDGEWKLISVKYE